MRTKISRYDVCRVLCTSDARELELSSERKTETFVRFGVDFKGTEREWIGVFLRIDLR